MNLPFPLLFPYFHLLHRNHQLTNIKRKSNVLRGAFCAPYDFEELFAINMNALLELQQWYRSQCDGDWEHGEGISIGTLDNPGWTLEISLLGTDLESRDFREHSYGVGENAEPSGEEWLTCKVEENVFKAFGGPFKLEEMIGVFLDWASTNGGPAASVDNSGAPGGQPSVS